MFNLLTTRQFNIQNTYPISPTNFDRLTNIHEKVVKDIPEFNTRSIVQGLYSYFHYSQDNFNDKVITIITHF